jgi:hypothetical protein
MVLERRSDDRHRERPLRRCQDDDKDDEPTDPAGVVWHVIPLGGLLTAAMETLSWAT